MKNSSRRNRTAAAVDVIELAEIILKVKIRKKLPLLQLPFQLKMASAGRMCHSLLIGWGKKTTKSSLPKKSGSHENNVGLNEWNANLLSVGLIFFFYRNHASTFCMLRWCTLFLYCKAASTVQEPDVSITGIYQQFKANVSSEGRMYKNTWICTVHISK